MFKGKLFIPTEVIFEKNAVLNNSGVFKRYGKKALIVTGKHSSRINGSLEDVVAALEKEAVEYVVYDDIEENPSIETVMKARDYGLSEGVDFIVGIGGGSPLDASKAIALMIKNKALGSEVLYTPMALEAIPVIAVPTTAGTGSEVTPYAILTIHEQRTKKSISHRIFPKVALVDSKYLKTQSDKGIINTAVDTLAHLVESYLNTNSNELNRLYSREGMRLFAQYKEDLSNKNFEEVVLEKMMYATVLGGMAISHTATSLPHGLSYMVTYETGEPHGKACGRYLADYLDLYSKNDSAEIENVLGLLGFNTVEGFRTYLEDLLHFEALPEGMDEKNWELLKSNQAKLKNYPFKLV